MIAKLKRLKRGFTLVELMIVVAIIGILAALAIYGVTKYVKNAKTAEARDALGRMAKDATGAYNRESMSNKVMGLSSATGISHRLCADATPVPAGGAPKAAKYQSSPTEWMTGSSSAGWTCLKFSMDDPQYFQYDYKVSSTDFSCLAHGNFDGDSSESTFSMAGGVRTAGGKEVAIVAPNIGETMPDE